MYVTPTVFAEFPTANQPSVGAPFHDREVTETSSLAGELRSKCAYIFDRVCGRTLSRLSAEFVSNSSTLDYTTKTTTEEQQ